MRLAFMGHEGALQDSFIKYASSKGYKTQHFGAFADAAIIDCAGINDEHLIRELLAEAQSSSVPRLIFIGDVNVRHDVVEYLNSTSLDWTFIVAPQDYIAGIGLKQTAKFLLDHVTDPRLLHATVQIAA